VIQTDAYPDATSLHRTRIIQKSEISSFEMKFDGAFSLAWKTLYGRRPLKPIDHAFSDIYLTRMRMTPRMSLWRRCGVLYITLYLGFSVCETFHAHTEYLSL